MLRTSIILIGALLLPLIAQAAVNSPLDTVKQMYEIGKKLEKGTEIIEMYSDPSLSYAFRTIPKDEVCIGADIMWNSQDPVFSKAITFQPLANNQVKVHLAKAKYDDATTLIYKFNCSTGQCKVADVIDIDGQSLKKLLKSCSR